MGAEMHSTHYDGPERRATQRVDEQRLRTLEMQMADIAVVMSDSVATAIRQTFTDPEFIAAVGAAIVAQGSATAQQRAGRALFGFIFSKVGAITILVAAVAWYVGPSAALKTLIGLAAGKGDA